MENKRNYDDSLKRIEDILIELEDGHKGMEELTELVKEASDLISFCKGKLKTINEEINKSFE